MPSFRIGKRSAYNARRFLMDVAGRMVFPKAGSSDDHAFEQGSFKPIVQISTDGFAGYPEAVDLAFGQFARYGVVIIKHEAFYVAEEILNATGASEANQKQSLEKIKSRLERFAAAILKQAPTGNSPATHS